MVILGIILGCIIGGAVCYFILAPTLQQHEEENEYIIQCNQEHAAKAKELQVQIQELIAQNQEEQLFANSLQSLIDKHKENLQLQREQAEKEELQFLEAKRQIQNDIQVAQAQAENLRLSAEEEAKQIRAQAINEANLTRTQARLEREEAQTEILKIQTEAKEATNTIYNTAYELMQEKLSQSAEQVSSEFKQNTDEYTAKYLEVLKEYAQSFTQKTEDYKLELAKLQKLLEQERSKATAAINARLREQEKKEKADFYTIGLSDLDQEEIDCLRSIIPRLRNGRPVYKAIWEMYYRSKTNDLINRVLGREKITGIYKITCLLDDKTYIGQALNMSDRWITHIKQGVGIDTPNDKFHPSMLRNGIENYSFELLETCEAAELNDREKYWIGFYQSNIYGYNTTAGGSRNV